ncbi:TldD/PmbA family protein [Treponema pedis]|uniref:Metalloprotease TldD/E C-terminal domain-containing protein n=2 Tax=Treponema pedis TaxID=409322 RepID=A0A7S7AV21_9SPIR|nr:metallopeptidase TldD-related protein [Treponema pedis]QOW59690.1 hypothetical protein IFE08_07320 [Treponema pedis]QSI05069.1 hypothetical protein DYQ05_09155 [Treponema pedis]
MKINFKDYFKSIADFILSEMLEDEKISISFSGEQSYFMRFNKARVRQNGTVEQGYFSFTFWKKNRTYKFGFGIKADIDEDKKNAANALQAAREIILLLPEDKYQSVPEKAETSETVYTGKLLPEDKIPEAVLKPAQDLDFTGLYSQGTICEGVITSAGASHWFQTDSFTLDYSVWLENGRGIKSLYSGTEWKNAEYKAKLQNAREGLRVLHIPQKKLEPGKYRAFISADALVDVIDFFSWNGFSERSMRQGSSAYLALREGREQLSEKFSLIQDFSLGLEPSFNSNGEAAPEKLTIVENGKLKNTLVSLRSETQYGVKSNGAPLSEGMRSIVIGEGNFSESEAVKELGTGIYISNFNYLNWSDTSSARITGMTRFACLWVEDGKIIAPITDMRWDESVYNMFGKNLLAVTKERHIFASTGTYGGRSTGGSLLPGILVKDFNCTL